MTNTDRQADRFQHGIGPYRMLKIEGRAPLRFCVGVFDLATGRKSAPNDGKPFLINDPIAGEVCYDGNYMRIINGEMK